MAARKKTNSQPKPRYHHGDLRRALIDASLALISEEGFNALTLTQVDGPDQNGDPLLKVRVGRISAPVGR